MIHKSGGGALAGATAAEKISRCQAPDPDHRSPSAGSATIVGDDRVHGDLPAEVLAAVHTAVTPACTTALVVPPFGSWAWCELAEDDPARGYAVVRAALAWWSGLVFGAGVPAEVLDRAVASRMAEASRDVAGAVDWAQIGRGWTPHAELVRRRHVTASAGRDVA